MPFIRFLHVLLGVTLSGLFVANYFYLVLAITEKNSDLLQFFLKKSLFIDCIFFLPVIFILFVTGSYQVLALNIAINTPWIISAYLFFTLVTLCWLGLFAIKSYNYIFVDTGKNTVFKWKKIFHTMNFMVMLLLIFIIHDAVRKMTFIPWHI